MIALNWFNDFAPYVSVKKYNNNEVDKRCHVELWIEFDEEVLINFNISKNVIYEHFIVPLIKEHDHQNCFYEIKMISEYPIIARTIRDIDYMECEKDIKADCIFIDTLIAKNITANDIECKKVCCCCVDSSVIRANQVYCNKISGAKHEIQDLKLPCGDWEDYI